jgi:hypothetical protein
VSRPRSWTDDDLRRAVATSRSQREVYDKLGLRQSGGAYLAVHRHARRLGIDLPMGRPTGRGRSWTDEDLRQAVAGAASLVEVARRLGLSTSGQGNQVLRHHAARLGLALPRGARP